MHRLTFRAQAFAFASRFLLAQVAEWFAGAPRTRLGKTRISAVWRSDQMAVAFDFGALVFLNVPRAILEPTLDTFSAGLPNEPHPPLREELLVEVEEGAKVEVGFDRVRVPALTPAAFEVIATVLAQSVCLDYYDEDVQGTLDHVHSIATSIAQSGRAPRVKDEIAKFVAASIASQIEILNSLSLLDKPDLTWDDPLADELHDKLRAAFEIPDRYRALEAKITTSRDAVAAFLEMMRHRRSFLLEATVVALIAFEIVLGLVKLH